MGGAGGDQSPEGNLPEGRQIAELDSETDSVGSCYLLTYPVTPASGFHGNPPASVMMVRQPRGLPRAGHKVSTISLAPKDCPLSPGCITVYPGIFFLLLNARMQHHRGKF